RPEEKMLVEAFRARGAELLVADDRELHGDLARWPEGLPEADVVLLRAKSHWRNVVLARWLEARGACTVNRAAVLASCWARVVITFVRRGAGVPVLAASGAVPREGGRAAAEDLGYPVVVKPVVGSWGRLIGLLRDPDALETVLDHKE